MFKCFDPEKPSLRPAFEREKHFYRLLKSLTIHQMPVLLVSGGEEEGTLLLSRIPGRRLREQEINRKAAQQAAIFIASVNQANDPEIARYIPMDAGACYAISDPLNAGADLVAQTQQYRKQADVPTLAFLSDKLEPIW